MSSGPRHGGKRRPQAGGRSQGGGKRRPNSGPKRQPNDQRRQKSAPSGDARRGSGPGGDQVEGRHAVRELLLAGTRRTREVVLAAGLDQADIVDDIIQLAEELRVPVRELARPAFEAAARTDSSQGIFAHADPLPTVEIEDLIAGPTPFLLMIDGVTDPHNLGAIFRTAEGAGVTGIILPRHRAARVGATVSKTAAGAVEHVPVAMVAGVPAALGALRDNGVWTVGLDEAGSRTIFDLDLASEPICLVLGAEGAGLSRLARERCDVLASLPMKGAIASLNVSVAASIAMYDITRRRMQA